MSQLVEGIYVGDFNLMAQGLIRVGATSGQVRGREEEEESRSRICVLTALVDVYVGGPACR